jgi:hypothetical protein
VTVWLAGVALAGLVMRGLWAQGEVTRVPAEPRLDHDGVRYAIAPHPRVIPTAAEAVDLVAARWLASHAPVRARDFSLAFGIAAGRASSALSPLKPLHVTVDGTSDAYLAPADFVAPDDTSSGVALLPLHDACIDAREQLALLGSAAMAQRATLRHLGNGPVVLVDGEAVGAWSWDDGRLAIHLTAGLPEADATRANGEAARVADFILRELRGVVALHGARAPRAAPLDHGDVTSER